MPAMAHPVRSIDMDNETPQKRPRLTAAATIQLDKIATPQAGTGSPEKATPYVEEQLATCVVMVEPVEFRPNPETMRDNKFSGAAETGKEREIAQVALNEWSGLMHALRDAGVDVKTFKGTGSPDEVFVNNWFSTHEDGRLVLYPVKHPSRSQERRKDIVDFVRSTYGLSDPVHDMTSWEGSNLALEGTGSLVLDRSNRIAYAAISKRTDPNVAKMWAAEMGYKLVTFNAKDSAGDEIYHTDVLMAVGVNFAVICTEVVENEAERKAILENLKKTGKVAISVTTAQMESHASNCLQLQSSKGSVLAISASGWEALSSSQRDTLESCVDQVVTASVPTLERLGGGSVRCMLAEIFPASDAGQAARFGGQLRAPAPASPDKAPQTVCSVDSEWGRLQLVVVHEPGMEVDTVMPWTLDNMKVDETFNKQDLKMQHRSFSGLLRCRGATVLHVKDLLTEVCQQGDEAKRDLFLSVAGQDILDKYPLSSLNVDCLFTGKQKRALEFEIPPLVNLFFMRDPMFAVPGGWIVISRPFYPIRQMESKLMKAILRLHPDLKHINVYDGIADDPECYVEGGDIIVADEHTVLIGVSQRTNEKGADKLAEFLFERTPVTRVVKVFIPTQRAFMHLDTLFTFVNKGVVLTMPYFWSQPEVYAEVARRTNTLNKFMGSDDVQDIECWVKDPPRIEVMRKGETTKRTYEHAMSGLQAEGIIDKALFVCGAEGSWPSKEEHVAKALTEQWNDAANVFCIAPGVVVAYKWCTRTVSHLQDAGVDVIELDGVELMKGRGGARCMTCPLLRSSAVPKSRTP